MRCQLLSAWLAITVAYVQKLDVMACYYRLLTEDETGHAKGKGEQDDQGSKRDETNLEAQGTCHRTP